MIFICVLRNKEQATIFGEFRKTVYIIKSILIIFQIFYIIMMVEKCNYGCLFVREN